VGDMADMINDGWNTEIWMPSPDRATRQWKFDCIVRETDDAWLIKFDAGFTTWFPKSRCYIKNNILYLPRWLKNRKIEEYQDAKKVTIKLGDKKL